MRKLQFGVIVALAAALLAVWMMRQQTLAQLQHQSEALARTQAALEELRAENTKLSAQVAEANPSAEQLTELLKLRSEVTRLRQQTNAIAWMREQNALLEQRLNSRTADAPASPAASKQIPEVPPQDIHPKESWKFAGYGTPEATMESMLWGAATQTNLDLFLAGFSPEKRAEIEKGLSQEDFTSKMAELSSKLHEFRVVDRKTISPDEMDLTVYIVGDAENHQDTTRYKRINGEWKVDK